MWQTPYGDANTLVTCGIWGIRPPATLDGPPPYLFQWNKVNQPSLLLEYVIPTTASPRNQIIRANTLSNG